jgi:hypothetical protein
VIYPHPQIYHHLKTIFVHVPKAAGTAVEQTLRLLPTDVVGGHTTALGFQQKYGALFDQYYKFALVRHPVDRFISAFYYLLQRSVHPALENATVHTAGNLEAFLDLLDADPLAIRRIVHFLPQHVFLCDAQGGVLVDSLYRFEALPDAWEEICRRIGLPHRELRKVNASSHRPWEEQATPRLVEFVESYYARDFELLDYSRDSTASVANVARPLPV